MALAQGRLRRAESKEHLIPARCMHGVDPSVLSRPTLVSEVEVRNGAQRMNVRVFYSVQGMTLDGRWDFKHVDRVHCMKRDI